MPGLVDFGIYFGMGLGFMLLYLLLYLYATPHREITLIRGDNLPAAVVLAGALLGFALPLANALRVASGVLGVAAWAVIAQHMAVRAKILKNFLILIPPIFIFVTTSVPFHDGIIYSEAAKSFHNLLEAASPF